MRDPYLYRDRDVLRNLLGIKDQKLLEQAEADLVVYRLKTLAQNPLVGSYDIMHYLAFHRYIFQDLYDWAGEIRSIDIFKDEPILGGQSIEYAKPYEISKNINDVLASMNSTKWIEMSHDVLANTFTQSMAKLWKIHGFREGNTRTTITFCCQFADDKGFHINRELFEKNAAYVRTALVAYNAYFEDGTDFSKKEYLEQIVSDAIS